MREFDPKTHTYRFKGVAEALPEEMWFNRDPNPSIHNHSPEVVAPFRAWHKRLKEIAMEALDEN